VTREQHERRAWIQCGFIAVFVIAVGTAAVLILDYLVRLAA
jgi:hypothetical protein